MAYSMGTNDRGHAPQGGIPQYQQYDGREDYYNQQQQYQPQLQSQDLQQSHQQQYQQPVQQQQQGQHLHPNASTSTDAGRGGSGSSLPPGPLPYPVILPQRRPKDRTRGFVRAYAPDLMRAGIDEPTFLAFLDGFAKALTSSPILGVIHLAGDAVGFIPSSIAPIIGLTMQVTVGVYEEVQNRKNQNAFITKANEELFKPHGLYCLIMAYNPAATSTLGQENYDSAAKSGKALRSNDGMMGSIEFPASAKLVYPNPGDNPSNQGSEDGESMSPAPSQGQGQSEGGMAASFSKALEDLKNNRDLKAQRKYMRNNPTAALNTLMDPKAELTEKDREKQAKKQEKDQRKAEKKERKAEKKALKNPDEPPKDPKKKKLKQDILYLMIINMPQKEAMEDAANLLNRQAAAAPQGTY
ncbi:hypothetical protein M426DRAFT_321579 [Hypoxylon sp. CI-4A]|nr:hypothetical protein M426DRAFT_321579 [Hypoxylon sp. CI-4A]